MQGWRLDPVVEGGLANIDVTANCRAIQQQGTLKLRRWHSFLAEGLRHQAQYQVTAQVRPRERNGARKGSAAEAGVTLDLRPLEQERLCEASTQQADGAADMRALKSDDAGELRTGEYQIPAQRSIAERNRVRESAVGEVHLIAELRIEKIDRTANGRAAHPQIIGNRDPLATEEADRRSIQVE